jgi:hypothetical protein
MRIYVLGSNAFMHEMVAAKDRLLALGIEGWIHPDYEALVRGEKQEILERAGRGEHAEVKRENNYFKTHFEHISQSDGVLAVNLTKNGVEHYIGGNVLIELGQAYVLDKKIFLLGEIPEELPYADEITAMDVICLHGELENITNYNC